MLELSIPLEACRKDRLADATGVQLHAQSDWAHSASAVSGSTCKDDEGVTAC